MIDLYAMAFYAKNVMKARWTEVEPIIKQNAMSWHMYKTYFPTADKS